jgi:hypothetical protein
MQVNRVLGKSNKILVNEKNAIDIINRARKIEKPIPNCSTINIKSTRKLNTFSDFFNNKKIMKVKR